MGRKKQQPAPSKQQAVKWMVRILKQQWKIGIVVLLFMGAGALFSPMSALVLKEILDHGLQGTSAYSLPKLLIGFALLPLLTGLFDMGTKYFSTLLTERTGNVLRSELYEKVQRKSITFLIRNKAGQLQQRILQEPGQVNSTLSSVVTQFISCIFVLISTISMMMYLSPSLTLVAIVTVPLTMLPGPISAKWTIPLNRKAMDVRADASSQIQETLSSSGSLLIKMSGTGKAELRNFERILQAITRFNLWNMLWMEGTATVANLLFAVGPIAVFWMASQQIGHQLTIGTVIAFTNYVSQLASPLKSIASVWVKVPLLFTMIDRLLEYRDDADELPIPEQPIRLSHVQGEIRFEHVRFQHDPKRMILQDIDLVIQPGETVALVGESGAGKTTIAHLVSRLTDPVQGRVLLDGHDLRMFDPADLCETISFVPQEPFLFHTTIRENIAYGCADVTDANIIHAAKQAQIHDVIASMPQGYDTIVGERGFKLSTGEKQRIALARVFLRDSKVVILDEVTSALDSVSEAAVKQALQRLLQGRTALIIAHRLSTIRETDRVLVLDHGEVVEEGTFEALVQRNGLFSRLYREQAGEQVQLVAT